MNHQEMQTTTTIDLQLTFVSKCIISDNKCHIFITAWKVCGYDNEYVNSSQLQCKRSYVFHLVYIE